MKNEKLVEYLRNGTYVFIAIGLLLLFVGFTGGQYAWNMGVGLLIVACLSLLAANSFVTVEVQKHQIDLLEEISRKMDR